MNTKQIIAIAILIIINFGVWVLINRVSSMLLPKWWDVVVSVPLAIVCIVLISNQYGKSIIAKL